MGFGVELKGLSANQLDLLLKKTKQNTQLKTNQKTKQKMKQKTKLQMKQKTKQNQIPLTVDKSRSMTYVQLLRTLVSNASGLCTKVVVMMLHLLVKTSRISSNVKTPP